MKIYAGLLALLVGGSSAFVTPNSPSVSVKTSTALESSVSPERSSDRSMSGRRMSSTLSRSGYGYGRGRNVRDAYGRDGEYGRRGGYGRRSGYGTRGYSGSRRGYGVNNRYSRDGFEDRERFGSVASENRERDGYGGMSSVRGGRGYGGMSTYRGGYRGYGDDWRMWDDGLIIQGSSLKTWTYTSPDVERVQINLRTNGRPVNADVDVWQGPDNTPYKMRVYVEDGMVSPFNCVVETPRSPSTIAVRNIGDMEFPMEAAVSANYIEGSAWMMDNVPRRTIQGQALHTYPFHPNVESVQVCLETDGRPLNARIELLQGPNNNKQFVEVYTEDGYERPFYAVVDTPGTGNVVRIVNTSPVEFPMTAAVSAYDIGNGDRGDMEPVVGGDSENRVY